MKPHNVGKRPVPHKQGLGYGKERPESKPRVDNLINSDGSDKIHEALRFSVEPIQPFIEKGESMGEKVELKFMLGGKSLDDFDLSPEQWVAKYCSTQGIEYHYKTNSISRHGEVIDSALLLSEMRLLTYSLDLMHLKPLLGDALNLWKVGQASKFLGEFRSQLKFQPTERDWVAEFAQACTGNINPLDAAVIRHFCWQVKRKLFGLPVEHHMMVVAYGKSGGGKSVAVRKLLRPLDAITLNKDMSVFNDAFGKRQFSRCYVMFLDELGKSHQTDVNSLKNIITSETMDWRGINSDSMMSGRQNCTFIGCSNEPVRERIWDTTSARRYWQLNCADQLDWDKINAIDALALWQSVDENGSCPIIPFLPEIQAIQERDIKGKDPVEEWLSAACGLRRGVREVQRLKNLCPVQTLA